MELIRLNFREGYGRLPYITLTNTDSFFIFSVFAVLEQRITRVLILGPLEQVGQCTLRVPKLDTID
jgi:hypothetical protein